MQLNGLKQPLLAAAVVAIPIAGASIAAWNAHGERIAKLEAQMPIATTERYHASDAARDLRIVSVRIDRETAANDKRDDALERRIDALANRVQALERRQ